MSGRDFSRAETAQRKGALAPDVSDNAWVQMISRKDSKESFENPQRLYARPSENGRMIQSGLHGNMQSAAEMSAPDESDSGDSPSNNHERS